MSYDAKFHWFLIFSIFFWSNTLLYFGDRFVSEIVLSYEDDSYY